MLTHALCLWSPRVPLQRRVSLFQPGNERGRLISTLLVPKLAVVKPAPIFPKKRRPRRTLYCDNRIPSSNPFNCSACLALSVLWWNGRILSIHFQHVFFDIFRRREVELPRHSTDLRLRSSAGRKSATTLQRMTSRPASRLVRHRGGTPDPTLQGALVQQERHVSIRPSPRGSTDAPRNVMLLRSDLQGLFDVHRVALVSNVTSQG